MQPNDRENARIFKHQDKQGPDLKQLSIWEGKETRKQATTYRVIITIERDPKLRKSKGHSVERDKDGCEGETGAPQKRACKVQTLESRACWRQQLQVDRANRDQVYYTPDTAILQMRKRRHREGKYLVQNHKL